MQQQARKCRRHRGATAVEFAVTAPVLFIMVFAAIEFGRVNMIRHSVENAAYEGARRGIVGSATDAQVEAAVNQHLSAVAVSGASTEVAIVGTDVSVTVNVPFAQNNWIAPFFFHAPTISASCSLSREGG